MEFLHGEKLDQAIRSIFRGRSIRCAVAFWGRGAETELMPGPTSDWRIICNLRMGGTNPDVIRKFWKADQSRVRQCDVLHAKVYLNDTRAVVTSANASTNGLGFEGMEQRRWIEAGVRLTEKAELTVLSDWFEKFWKNRQSCRQIFAHDLKYAKEAFLRHRHAKPTLPTFADFDPDGRNLPLLTYSDGGDWVTDKAAVKKQLGSYDHAIERRIYKGVEIEGDKDKKLMKPGTWVLRWPISSNSTYDKRCRCSWVNLGNITVRKAGRYKGDKQVYDVVAEAETPSPEPFDITEDRFQKAFAKVIDREKYKDLRADNYSGDWFFPRREQTHLFWRDLKSEYEKASL
jgi:hypothetical protein